MAVKPSNFSFANGIDRVTYELGDTVTLPDRADLRPSENINAAQLDRLLEFQSLAERTNMQLWPNLKNAGILNPSVFLAILEQMPQALRRAAEKAQRLKLEKLRRATGKVQALDDGESDTHEDDLTHALAYAAQQLVKDKARHELLQTNRFALREA